MDRRTIWFEVPIGAPIWWDIFAVIGLVFCGLAILWVSARPDMAAVAERGTGWRTRLLSRLSMGWRGTERQWKLQAASLALLGAFYFMLLVFVHTLVSLDFALSLVPGWKDSIFAPYHALTGLQAAGGTVLVTLFIMRTFGGYREYIGMDPFWSLGKILLGLTLLWGYFWFSEFMTFWYGRDPTEQTVIKLVMMESYRTAFLLNVVFSFILPFGILLWNGLRRSIIGPTIAGASVVLGTLFMMIRLYVPAFNIPQEDMGSHTIADFAAGSWPDSSPATARHSRRVGRVYHSRWRWWRGPDIPVGHEAAAGDVYVGDQGGADVHTVSPLDEGSVPSAGVNPTRREMQEGRSLTDREINRNLLSSIFENPLWYWGLVAGLGMIVLGAMAATGYMFNQGLGVTGLNRPVMWGFFITNFVFWIGISHAGVMLSAILRLSKAEWRRPATRAAEVLTVFSLMTAMLMPLIHAGRPWRVFYWVFPYDWARGVYPNVRSALIWDPSAVFT